MATKDKYYLDEVGLEHLRDWVLLQLLPLTKDIDLLQKTDGTPGSIQYMLDTFFDEGIRFYGGSDSDLIGEEYGNETN